jgi:hypothetical protein
LAAPSLWALQPSLVQGDNVNVRGRASLAGEILFQLHTGDPIQMVDKIVVAGAKKGEPSRWAQIQLPASIPVYVHGSFLDGDTVAASKLNIRSGPGEKYSVLGRLQRGDKIRSLGQQGDWVQISPTPETYAFIAADYVGGSASPPPVASPVVATLASLPSVPAPAPMKAELPAPPVSPPPAEAAAPVAPPAVPTVTAGVGTVPIAEAPPLATVAPVVVSQVEPTAPLFTPPASPSVTLAQAQPVPPDEQVDEMVAQPAPITPPVAPTVPDGVETVPIAEAPPLATVAPVVVAQAEPTAPLFTPPASPSVTLAQAQPVSPDKQVDKMAAKPAPTPAAAAPAEDLSEQLQLIGEKHHLNRLSFGYRFGLNISAEFKGFGASPQTPPGIFDDGYVLPSSRQTGGSKPAPDGRTWNWGYDSPTQVQGGNLLQTKSYAPAAPATSHTLDDNRVTSGLELTYARELWSGGRSNACHFGVEAAFNYSVLDSQSTWQHSMAIVRTVSTYALGGVVPPYDPATPPPNTYQGTYNGPGPTIPLIGTPGPATTIPGGASMTSYRELEANTYGLRFGPFFESPIYKRLWGTVGTGLALGMVDGEVRYRDSYTDGVRPSSVYGSASDFSVLVGWYIGGGVSYKLSHCWSLFYNAQYQWLPDYTLNVDATEAKLKAGNGLFQSIGISYSF